jgi:hypothetical protein
MSLRVLTQDVGTEVGPQNDIAESLASNLSLRTQRPAKSNALA